MLDHSFLSDSVLLGMVKDDLLETYENENEIFAT